MRTNIALLCLLGVAAVAGSSARPERAIGVAPEGHAFVQQVSRPVLAFYYTWYHPSTFCACTMSDLPKKAYESGDPATIDRQIRQAWRAGITGFITSWPGPGNTQDANLALLLDRIARFDRATGARFVTSVYFESDADAVHGNLRGAMQYLVTHYTGNPYFFRWHAKPVIFIWDPVGNGRTLATWAAIRREVDPRYHLLWSAEGTDMSLLSVFDGIHLFSAAYWGVSWTARSGAWMRASGRESRVMPRPII